MHLKVLLVAFLCLLSVSVICNVATPIVKASKDRSFEESMLSGSIGYNLNNGTDPDGGDPREGGWPN